MAEENTEILYRVLGEFFEGTWAIAKKGSDSIDANLVKIKTEGKELYSTIMLRNIISDLCCCLDSLERGHWRTIVNSLRVALEDYCCALQLYADPEAYALFLIEKLDAPKSVTFAKRHRQQCEHFGRLYGEYSSIVHHSQLSLLTRQMVSIDNVVVCYAHLKSINPSKLTPQISTLPFIAFLLMEIGVLAEEICLNLVEEPYFGEKTKEGYQRRFDIPEAIFIRRLAEKAYALLHPPTSPPV